MSDKQTILLLNNEATECYLTARSLEEQGCTVLSASNGQEGLDIFHTEKENITAVITDNQLSSIPDDIQGPDVVREIKAELPHLPVIVASHYVSTGIEKKAYEAGADLALLI